jgi:hypothetical protein
MLSGMLIRPLDCDTASLLTGSAGKIVDRPWMLSRLPSTKGAEGMDRNIVYGGICVVLAGLLGFSWAPGRGAANADGPRLPAGEIAVVDLPKLFAGHKAFTARREQLNRETQDATDALAAIIQAGKKLES